MELARMKMFGGVSGVLCFCASADVDTCFRPNTLTYHTCCSVAEPKGLPYVRWQLQHSLVFACVNGVGCRHSRMQESQPGCQAFECAAVVLQRLPNVSPDLMLLWQGVLVHTSSCSFDPSGSLGISTSC